MQDFLTWKLTPETLTKKILFVMNTNMAAFKNTKTNSERKRTTKRLDGSGSSLKIEKKTKKTIKRVGAEIRPRKNTRKVRKVSVLDLQRSNKNPIIEPNAESYWESKATFNPTALEHDEIGRT